MQYGRLAWLAGTQGVVALVLAAACATSDPLDLDVHPSPGRDGGAGEGGSLGGGGDGQGGSAGALGGGGTISVGGTLGAGGSSGAAGSNGTGGSTDAGGASGAGGALPEAGPPESGAGGSTNEPDCTERCGGECTPCVADGDPCIFNWECESGFCPALSCVPGECDDGVQNGGETDVDCGGPDCPPCADGKSCIEHDDCQSRKCDDVCLEADCDDEIQNGLETDVDCGGAECDPCEIGEGCLVGSDCESGYCDGVVGECAEVPDPVAFSFETSHLDARDLDESNTPMVNLSCGVTELDTETGVFTNFCGEQQPAVTVENGMLVVPVRTLSIAEGSTLRISGTRPAFIAVFGDANISGTIDGSATGIVSGPGGNVTCEGHDG